MKKAGILLTAAALCAALCGCGLSEKQQVAGPDWRMDSVQSREDGGILAVGSPDRAEACLEASLADLTCRFTETGLTLSRRDTGESFTGSYKLVKRGGSESAIYEIAFDGGETAHAVRSVTTYLDKEPVDTLILSTDAYAITFYADSADA